MREKKKLDISPGNGRSLTDIASELIDYKNIKITIKIRNNFYYLSDIMTGDSFHFVQMFEMKNADRRKTMKNIQPKKIL